MKKNSLTSFGVLIKKELLDKNIALTDLANEIGTTPEYLSYILHGKRAGKKYIHKIKEILDLKNEVTKVE